MKTLIFAMLMALPSIAFTQTKKMAEADIRGRNCKGGFGLCGFNTTTIQTTKSSAQPKVSTYKLTDNALVMVLQKSKITAEEIVSLNLTKETFAKKDFSATFKQEEDLVLDASSLQSLALNPKYSVIPAGNYAMKLTDTTIEITFILQEP